MKEWKERLASPAQNALTGFGIRELEDLSKHTRFEIESLHGIGETAMNIIEKVMELHNLDFRTEEPSHEVDEYIGRFPEPARKRLEEIRDIIRKRIPRAKEKLAYGMPTYYYKKYVVHFAGFKNHIGFFPTPGGIVRFKEEIQDFVHSKAVIQFPLVKEMPKELIERIVDYRMKEVKRGE